MITPTIHHNGTSRERLLEGYLDAMEAVREALSHLNATAPNGRDYYPQGNTALQEAQKQHNARCEKLLNVCRELSELAAYVDESRE
jgi:hypothetical protein